MKKIKKTFYQFSHEGLPDLIKIRDGFASAALAGMLVNGSLKYPANEVAHDAYLYADEMLKARMNWETLKSE